MTMLDQIGGIAALGSLILSREATLVRGAQSYPVRASRQRSQKPYRATENRKPFDAQFRMDASTSPVEPYQNDTLSIQGEEWLIWRIIPSAASSHWTLECMALPTVSVVPVRLTPVDDGIGGRVSNWSDRPMETFYAKVREGSVDRQLTAESSSSMGRLAMSYRAGDAPAGFSSVWRVMIQGATYEIASITIDDENPLWRNAVLVREGSL